MYLDAQVARRKFAIEVERVNRQANMLHTWGCWIVRHDYPHVDALFVPRRPLAVSFPIRPASQATTGPPEPQQFVQVEVPTLAARAFGVRIGLDDFDMRAPSVTFCDPWTWEALPYDRLQRGNLVDDHGTGASVLLGAHPLTKRPFLCTRGIREYHEHPQHSGDDWMLYRGDFGLFAALTTIWRTCVDQARPNLVFAVVPPATTPIGSTLAPQLQLQVLWEFLKDR